MTTDEFVNAMYNALDVTTLAGGGTFKFGVPNTFWTRGREEGDTWLAVDARNRDADLRARLRTLMGTSTTSLKLAVIGDSITVGGNSVDGTGYRGWLKDLLDRRNTLATIDASAATNGGTLTTQTPLVAGALASNPDIVLLMVGTNDAASHDTGSWQARYTAVIDQILASSPTVKVACAKIVIAHPVSGPGVANLWPPGNLTLPADEATLNTWVVAAVNSRSSTGRVALADMTAIPSTWLRDNGWHPGDAGYARMASIWLTAIGAWLP